jgi:bla regulator protein BlaR1
MANWSQSHFLQSLGWATLNSFWQMALLWCIYSGASSLFRITAHRKYQLSVLAILTGFVWFVFSFLYFFQSSSLSTVSLFNQTIRESNNLLNTFLLSASLAYLSLLIFPSYRLFRNWQFVQRIKKQGLRKADLHHRLFVQRIAAQLGIRKKVLVHLSELVNSPVTIGYIKPLILLPVAALNNLSTQQVEAILLHELSHIKRYDYLVNFMISIINTILYFNPFVKQFVKTIEEERENCCDQLVLQFEYDKVGYASALLTLEKLSVHQQILALGATGKHFLLSRIEKIVGMEKKKGFKRNQFAGLLAAVFCIVIFNSILIIKEKSPADQSFAYNNLNNPFSPFDAADASGSHSIIPVTNRKADLWIASAPSQLNTGAHSAAAATGMSEEAMTIQDPPSPNDQFINVALDDVDASLTKEQKDKVKSTVAATKKVIANLQWKEVENVIADAMDEQEKVQAKQEYMTALDQSVNWGNVEQNMKAQYEKLDWKKINNTVKNGLTAIHLDSLQKSYMVILDQLDKANTEACTKARIATTPMPDQSIEEIRKSRQVLREKVATLKALRSPKKVVRL